MLLCVPSHRLSPVISSQGLSPRHPLTSAPASPASPVAGIRSHRILVCPISSIPRILSLPDEWSDAQDAPCFFLAKDQATKSIVIAVRGTCTVADAITDLTCEAVPFLGGQLNERPQTHAEAQDTQFMPIPPIGACMYIPSHRVLLCTLHPMPGEAHGGMANGAKYILQETRGQLQSWLEDGTLGPTGSKLVVTGHSLGAGISVLLTMLIHDAFPGIRGCVQCRAFAPPPVFAPLSKVRADPRL